MKTLKYLLLFLQIISVSLIAQNQNLLTNTFFPPRNFNVNTLTGIASWLPPRITALYEDFNGTVFPPDSWQMQSSGQGWFQTTDGSGSSWLVPFHKTNYACVNNDTLLQVNVCYDYLITPYINIQDTIIFSLKFQSFFNGQEGQEACVEFQLQDDTVWYQLAEIIPSDKWENIYIQLNDSLLINQDFKIRFFAFCSDSSGSGWAIDNVDISANEPLDPLGYNIYLNNTLKSYTHNTAYQIYHLIYGEIYTAGIEAVYPDGVSDIINKNFRSGFLASAINLGGILHNTLNPQTVY